MDLVIIALTIHQMVNIYRYSYYFVSFRSNRETGRPIWILPRWSFIQDWAASLFACPWCMSVVIGLLITLLYYFVTFGKLFCMGLAAAQLANLMHFCFGHRGIKQD